MHFSNGMGVLSPVSVKLLMCLHLLSVV